MLTVRVEVLTVRVGVLTVRVRVEGGSVMHTGCEV